MAIQLAAVYGVAIPVIVRQGETAATTRIPILQLVPTATEAGPVLRVFLGRTGNRSVFGDLNVSLTRGAAAPVPVGRVNGVAVYVPDVLRHIDIPLNIHPPFGGGNLLVSWQSRSETDELPVEAAIQLR